MPDAALWMLAGVGAYLVLGALVGALVDIEVRDALIRVLFAPVGLFVSPLVWLSLRLPTARRFPLARLRGEMDAHHHVAVGVAWRTWALVAMRRTGPKPPEAERVP